MKIICAYLCNHEDRGDYFMSLMPYGITSITAFLEQNGFEVTLANFSHIGAESAVQEILKISPDYVFISIFSFNRTESLKLIKKLKQKNPLIKTVIGGHHPTFLYNEITKRYPEIDYIITGEGEDASLQLLRDGSAEKVIHGIRSDDIDRFPPPAFFKGTTIGVNKNEQFRYIITSRGCPSRCRYCSSPGFWKRKVSMRDPRSIVSELRYLQEKHGLIYFSIRDDNFTLNKKRVLEFCRLLEDSELYFMWNCQARVDTVDMEMLTAMKKNGLEHIQYGVESGSEKILGMYDKSISIKRIKEAAALTREAGIYLSYYLMAGMKDETDHDIDLTISLIKETLPHDVIVSPVAYYPGTDIYFDGVRSDKITDDIWFNRNDNGLYLSDLSKTRSWIKRIIRAGESIRAKSYYKPHDFKDQRKSFLLDCWTTDLMEGDALADTGNYNSASKLYMKVIRNHNRNPWGYMKLAEICNDASEAERLLVSASKIVPNCHNIWQRLGEIQNESGKTIKALESFKKAASLNPTDTALSGIIRKLS